ncbi:MAG TPA: hypothetical protein DCM64_03805 [Gammaproteobacteria bacterium]|jgi:hypothetical protein|nr:hypothetical protein [Gammaproteobacteria bacterium]|tara:strand:+ start:816 stop:1079 length:264 start_codon:yes stop_codon:yes gene_type:complete
MDLNRQGQAATINLTITENGGELGGTWQGPRNTQALSDVSFVGDTLTYSIQTRQGAIQMSFKLGGNTLNGSLSTPQGDLNLVAKKST